MKPGRDLATRQEVKSQELGARMKPGYDPVKARTM